jgi:hypothetical protein
MTREPARLAAVLLADVTPSPKHGVREGVNNARWRADSARGP